MGQVYRRDGQSHARRGVDESGCDKRAPPNHCDEQNITVFGDDARQRCCIQSEREKRANGLANMAHAGGGGCIRERSCRRVRHLDIYIGTISPH